MLLTDEREPAVTQFPLRTLGAKIWWLRAKDWTGTWVCPAVNRAVDVAAMMLIGGVVLASNMKVLESDFKEITILLSVGAVHELHNILIRADHLVPAGSVYAGVFGIFIIANYAWRGYRANRLAKAAPPPGLVL